MKRQILLVDDNIDFLDSTKDVLENAGYEVTPATSGTEAVQLVKSRDFDVVVMDIKMPGLNGAESFIEMKKIKAGKAGHHCHYNQRLCKGNERSNSANAA